MTVELYLKQILEENLGNYEQHRGVYIVKLDYGNIEVEEDVNKYVDCSDRPLR